MDVTRVQRTRSAAHGADAPVAALGAPGFGSALFRHLRDMTGCAHALALAIEGEKPKALLLAANTGEGSSARDAARRYMAEHWAHDPSNFVPQRPDDLLCLRFSPAEIGVQGYRRDCYSAFDLVDRLSLVQGRQGGSVRLNLYRSSSDGRFSETTVERVISAARVLFSLLMKQQELEAANPNGQVDVRKLLEELEPKLSPRELDICVGICTGLSSEGIALTHGISINSVLTFRKRAYSRLGISSQNQLMRLLMARERRLRDDNRRRAT
jgi:LuxR family transcriptional regulator, activator of tox operons